MTLKEKNCLSRCPKCDSVNICWCDSELNEQSFYYDGKCNDCGCEFTEQHYLTYNVTQYNEE